MIKLDSFVINPSSIDVEVEFVGEEKRMADGSLRFFQRAIKRTWTFAFDKVPATLLTSLTIKAGSITIAYTDEAGTIYTTIPRGLSHTLSADNVEIGNILRYDITFILKEK